MQTFLFILTKAPDHYRDLPRIFWSASSYLFWFSSTRLNKATYQKSSRENVLGTYPAILNYSQGDGLLSKAEVQKRVKKTLNTWPKVLQMTLKPIANHFPVRYNFERCSVKKPKITQANCQMPYGKMMDCFFQPIQQGDLLWKKLRHQIPMILNPFFGLAVSGILVVPKNDGFFSMASAGSFFSLKSNSLSTSLWKPENECVGPGNGRNAWSFWWTQSMEISPGEQETCRHFPCSKQRNGSFSAGRSSMFARRQRTSRSCKSGIKKTDRRTNKQADKQPSENLKRCIAV